MEEESWEEFFENLTDEQQAEAIELSSAAGRFIWRVFKLTVVSTITLLTLTCITAFIAISAIASIIVSI